MNESIEFMQKRLSETHLCAQYITVAFHEFQDILWERNHFPTASSTFCKISNLLPHNHPVAQIHHDQRRYDNRFCKKKLRGFSPEKASVLSRL